MSGNIENGYYFLMCDYYSNNQSKNGENLSYECLLHIQDNFVQRYSVGDQVDGYTHFYYLLWALNEDKIQIENTEPLKIKECLCNRFLDLKARSKYDFLFVKTFLNSGKFYPKIYRPFLSNEFIEHKRKLPPTPDKQVQKLLFEDIHIFEEAEYLSRLNQLELLIDELSDIFKIVEPIGDNMNCYGHKIRNLIILACTEIDSICKDVLTSNNYPSKQLYKTKDFVLLKEPLKLDQYVIKFKRYPEIEGCSPFKNWTKEKPTKTLYWYDSYNAVKHDRINNYKLATINCVIDSISAVAIMLIAQFGDKNIYWADRMAKYFDIINYPNWDYSDLYIPPISNHFEFNEVKYDFAQ